MNPDEEQPYVAQACRSCSLSRKACEAKRSRDGEPCCGSCVHLVPVTPDLGEPSEDW